MSIETLPIGEKAPEAVNVVIEIPAKSGKNKYEYDEEHHVFRLDRVIRMPVQYPIEYGFMPETRAEDGDHLDAMVLMQEQTFPGCVVDARPIALLRMVDDGDPDPKILCVPAKDAMYEDVNDLDDIPELKRKEIVEFFTVYKRLKGSAPPELQGWEGKDAAVAMIKASMEAHRAE